MAELKRPSLEESISGELSANNPESLQQKAVEPLGQRLEAERSKSFQEKFPSAYTTTVSQEQRRPEMSWGQVGSEALRNAPGSIGRAVVATVEPFLSPVETAKGLYSIGKGAVSKAGLIPGQTAKEKAEAEESLNAIGRVYANRYGSMEGFKQALAEDPASVLMDASTIFTGAGGLAKVGGLARAGKTLSTAGKLTDPLTAIPTAIKKIPGSEKGLSAVGDYITAPMEYGSGVVPGSISTAVKAGFSQEPKYDAFVQQMRKQVPATNIVNKADDIIRNVATNRKTEYLQGMNQPLTQKIVDLNPIQKMVNDKLAETAHVSSGAVVNEIKKAIDEFQNKGRIVGYRGSSGYQVPDPMNPTIYDVDKLKQHIADIIDDPYSPGGAVASEIASNIGKEIRKVDKGYADIMDRYADATEELKKFRTVSGKSGQIPEARLAKIMKGAKDKYKRTIFDEMSEIDPDLAMALKGESMAHWGFPGLTELAAIGGAGSLFVHPAAGAAAMAADIIRKNPRIMGEIGYKVGQTARLADKASESGVLPIARQYGYQQMREEAERRKEEELKNFKPFEVTVPVGIQPPQQADGGRVARASGGRIDIETGVRALMNAAENAKKSISKTTENLLKQPDEHIAQALNVAKRHI